MQNYILIQLGAGGMSWLVFIVGLLWCSFAWWRAYRCKRALACIISTITSLVSGLITIVLLVGVSMRFAGSSGTSENMIELIALALFVLTGISWAAGSICFLLAAIKSQYPSPEELATESTPHSPTPHPH